MRGLGVKVLAGASVDDVRPGSVVIAGRETPCGAVVWGGRDPGDQHHRAPGGPLDRAGRVSVDPTLAIAGRDDAYAIGDCALCLQDGQPLPALAQVAKQQGEYLGRVLGKLGGVPDQPFLFQNQGNAAVVGRNAAVFDFGKHHLRGRVAWLLWALVHVYLLVGFDKRLFVTMQWVWRYLTYERGAQMIMPDGLVSTVEPFLRERARG
ncbi:hypothetical protein SLNSH_06135 [Alsobacter soli]|uniref:NADH:ubiquinone reductase (non-electrogenic) n=1 Tax=Alsobacter soli TaxID=2109933 RepID=A0A2T1HWA3_9HYPH|nr:hypothetical protein SLNSH_06135 [Alsobacter soli]